MRTRPLRRRPRGLRGSALALLGLSMGFLLACGSGEEPGRESGSAPAVRGLTSMPADRAEIPWNSSTIYFLLTDRFHNGDPSNDRALGREGDGAVLRSYLGGDLKGVLAKLQEGYFEALGVDVLWMTPFHEQIAGSTDEGTGRTYAFHGYWGRDWTAVDPNLGTYDDLKAVVEAAHDRGIRVVMDAVLQHPGPVTDRDGPWPEDWVRGGEVCRYRDYETTVSCDLVRGLPDFRTESDEPVELPDFLVEKWRAEGRLEEEMAELDAFFQRTGHPRAPRYHLIKWLTDWVRELGFDGYRVDTAKHFEEEVSAELQAEGARAFEAWKAENPDRALDDRPFWFMGEVYNYGLPQGRLFDFGDRSVDYYAYGYDALINFHFKSRDTGSLEELFSLYSRLLREGELRGVATVNYLSSHDDGSPWDRDRERPYEAANRLLLAPGAAQIYYGDELARPLTVEGAEGDANLRSPMPWERLESDPETRALLRHWQLVGRFREAHPAVGAGAHRMIQADPYVFSRVLEPEVDGVEEADRVVVALDLPDGPRTIPVGDVFPDGARIQDAYTGEEATVVDGVVTLAQPASMALLAPAR